MTTVLFATSLLLGHATVEPSLDARPKAEPAISIVDALLVEVTEQTVTTGEPVDAQSHHDAREGERGVALDLHDPPGDGLGDPPSTP